MGEAYVGGLVNLRGTRMETAEKDADLIEAVLGELGERCCSEWVCS